MPAQDALTPARLSPADIDAELTLVLGQTMWSEPGAAPTLINASDRPAEFLRIDLK
jgi:hypothetical protein